MKRKRVRSDGPGRLVEYYDDLGPGAGIARGTIPLIGNTGSHARAAAGSYGMKVGRSATPSTYGGTR